MPDLTITAAPQGRWATNCVVIAEHATGAAVVVDPGEDATTWVEEALGRLDVDPVAVLLTHGHLDHLWSAPWLAASLDVPVHLHAADHWLWEHPGAGFGAADGAASRVLLSAQLGLEWDPTVATLVAMADGDRLAVGSQPLMVAHTPGHTPGSSTFLLPDVAGADVLLVDGASPSVAQDVLVAGDLLFAGSIGRSDLPGGDPATMNESLRRYLPTLADDTLVVPGHGPHTTIGAELRTNPWVRQALAQT